MHKQRFVCSFLFVFAFGSPAGAVRGDDIALTLSAMLSPAQFSVVPAAYGHLILNPRRMKGGEAEPRTAGSLPVSLVTIDPPRHRPFRDDFARTIPPSDIAYQLTADAWNVAMTSARPPYEVKTSDENSPPNPTRALVNARSQWLDDLEASNARVETALRAARMRELAELRRRYPYVSVAGRLKGQRAVAGEPPQLTEAATHDLHNMEANRFFRQGADAEAEIHRVYSLQALHSGQVDHFSSADGFGNSRLIGPRPKFAPEYVEYASAPPVDVEPSAPLSGEFGTSRPLSLPPTVVASRTDPYRLPSIDVLGAFHRAGQFAFVPGGSLGDVASVNYVAGFTPHGFRQMPAWPDEEHIRRYAESSRAPRNEPQAPQPSNAPPSRWKVTRLELVGLLLHQEPRVYESDQLPRMEELEKYSTRSLNTFEAESLKKLRAGEQLASHADLNEIRMLGALRAAHQCMKCHQVPRGTLLGAFSYTLQRDPLLRANEVNGKLLVQ